MKVSARDVVAVRRSLSSSPVPLTSRCDFNRDGRVDALDVAAARSNLSRILPLPSAGVNPLSTAAAVAATGLLRTT